MVSSWPFVAVILFALCSIVVTVKVVVGCLLGASDAVIQLSFSCVVAVKAFVSCARLCRFSCLACTVLSSCYAERACLLLAAL